MPSKHVNSLHILTYRTTCINLLLWQHYWHHISDRLTGSPSSPLTTFTQVTTRLPDLDLPLLTPIQLPLVFVNEPRPTHTSDTRWRYQALTSKPVLVHVKKPYKYAHRQGRPQNGWEYVLVFAFEFTPIVTIVNKTLLKLRFVKLIFGEICFYRNAAILNALLKHTECSNISFLIYNI